MAQKTSSKKKEKKNPYVEKIHFYCDGVEEKDISDVIRYHMVNAFLKYGQDYAPGIDLSQFEAVKPPCLKKLEEHRPLTEK